MNCIQRLILQCFGLSFSIHSDLADRISRYEIAIKDVVMHCASTYPYIACEVNTALEGLDESEPYSAWYSPKILYLYSVTFGDRVRIVFNGVTTGLTFACAGYQQDSRK